MTTRREAIGCKGRGAVGWGGRSERAEQSALALRAAQGPERCLLPRSAAASSLTRVGVARRSARAARYQREPGGRLARASDMAGRDGVPRPRALQARVSPRRGIRRRAARLRLRPAGQAGQADRGFGWRPVPAIGRRARGRARGARQAHRSQRVRGRQRRRRGLLAGARRSARVRVARATSRVIRRRYFG